MTLNSFSEFIEQLEGAGELVRVRHPVSVDLEICEIADRAMKLPGGGGNGGPGGGGQEGRRCSSRTSCFAMASAPNTRWP